MKIDVHCHVFTLEMFDRLEAEVGLRVQREPERGIVRTRLGIPVPASSEAGLLADLDRYGINMQALTARTVALYDEEDLARDLPGRYRLSRAINGYLGDLCRRHPRRFMGFADIDLVDPDRALEELGRALDGDGLHGVSLLTNMHGRPLDAPEFRPFFEEANRRGLTIFLHPAHPADMALYRDYHLYTVAGYPFDTTLAVARLIFSGVIERCPRVRLILSHAGGTIPYLWHRLDHAYHENWSHCRDHISQPPTAYLRDFYYDTALSFRGALQLAYECVGDHLVLGTDFPYIPSDVEHTFQAIEGLDVPAEVKANTFGGNAAKLLRVGA